MAPSTHSSSPRDLALTVWLEELATGRRVLWVGDASSGATERLGLFAHQLRVLDTSGRGRSRRKSRVTAYRGLDDLKAEAAYDLVVVPDASVFEHLAEACKALQAAAGDGVLVIAADAGDDPDGAYSALLGSLEDTFREVRMMAEGAFHAVGLVDLESQDTGVVVDGSLLGDQTEPIRCFVAVAADEVPPFDAHVLVQVRQEAERRPVAESDGEKNAVEIDALRTELERSASRLQQAQARLVATEAELAEARSALGKGSVAENASDFDRLESGLRDRGHRVRELEMEIERRAMLVRDITEELRERSALPAAAAGSDGDADPIARALDAEAARDEARFRADELSARLGARDRALRSVEDERARFEGRVRGYRSRVAELEELGELGAARIHLFELDAAAARERIRALEGRIAESREELELALIQARGQQSDGGASDGAETEALEAELKQARADLESATIERDRARAEALQLTAQLGLVETRMEGLRLGYEMRIAMLGPEADPGDGGRIEALRAEADALRGARDGLRLRVADLQASALALRSAPNEAADAADGLRADVEALRADNAELTLRLADVESAGTASAQRAADLTSALAARDALVIRLQMDLAEEEQAARLHDQQMRRLEEENDRLREGVVAASEAVSAQEAAQSQVLHLRDALAAAEARAAQVDESLLESLRIEAEEAARALREARADAAEAREHVQALEKRQSADSVERTREHGETVRRLQDELAARRAEAERAGQLEEAMGESRLLAAQQAGLLEDALHALRETRRVVDGFRAAREGERPARSEITAMGVDAPDAEESKLRRELDDKETLLRSLTAQLEERDDRLRAMERRMAEGPTGPGDDAGELLELEERVARLQEELRHERDARSSAEQELDTLSRRPNAEEETERVRAQLQTREAALDVARSRARAAAKDVESLREVCADTRHGLEELLGAATSAGDPATAERIGALLSVLSRY